MLVFLLSLGLVGVLFALERLWPARRDATQHRLNLLIWATRLPLNLLLLPAIGAAIAAAAGRAGLPSLHVSAWPFALGAAVYLVVHDFGEFAFHRAQHAIPWMWRMHSLHHSDPCMGATTTERHFWGDGILKAVTIWPAAALLLQPSPAQLAVFSLAYSYNYFVHANLPVDFGRLSWVLNSPAYHRLHHSRAPEDYGANLAALFPVWDVLFGTYRPPAGRFVETGDERRPKRYFETIVWPTLPAARTEAPDALPEAAAS
jgi:sterol desaturase/sphingolipid hydroxylase (fatty acid hydroxylase superfamily)